MLFTLFVSDEMKCWLQIYDYFSRNCAIRMLKQIKALQESHKMTNFANVKSIS